MQGLFVGAPYHDVPALVAFLTILVTTVNFVVSVEVNFYPKYKNYYSLFNDKGAVGDITQAGEEMLKVLNVELKYTALKQLLATALAISLGGLLLEYVPLDLTILWKGISEPSAWDMAFMQWQIPYFCCFYILQITKERWRPPDVLQEELCCLQ